MMVDYCWLLHRDDPQATYKRKKCQTKIWRKKEKTLQGLWHKVNVSNIT
jgi:hypothetical protein